MTVPAFSVLQDTIAAGPAAASGSPYYVQFPHGDRQGPMSFAEVQKLLSVGKLTAECQLFQEGWSEWRWADTQFPQLKQAPRPASNTFASSTHAPPVTDPNNPYAAPTTLSSSGPTSQYLKPHRGGVVLTFGILSLVSCLCSYFSILGLGFSISAWVMANNDLKEMAMGTMDPSGQGTTQAGKILGIVHIGLVCLFLVLIVAWIGIMVAVEAGR